MASKTDVARRAFEAFMAKDRDRMEALLADDLTFTSPYDDAIDRSEYFRRCWPNNDRVKAFEIEKICEDDEGAYVTYSFQALDGKVFHNTEYMRIEGAQIRSIEVFFGAEYKAGRFLRKD